MQQLSHGDLTDVGEAGSALSEGQRARVALARAIYADADALFLDGTLAAVDAHTSAALWQTLRVLQRRGKAVVLTTQQVALLSQPEVCRITLMRDGQITACAPPSQLQAQWCFAASGEDVKGGKRYGGGGGSHARHALWTFLRERGRRCFRAASGGYAI